METVFSFRVILDQSRQNVQVVRYLTWHQQTATSKRVVREDFVARVAVRMRIKDQITHVINYETKVPVLETPLYLNS